MNILKLKSILFCLVAVLTFSVFLTSCEQDVLEQPLITNYDNAKEVLEKYVVEQDGIYILSEQDPNKLGIDLDVFNQLTESLNQINQLITEGEVKREWINKTIDIETLEEVELEVRGCNESKISWGLFSATVYLSKDKAAWVSLVGCGAAGSGTFVGGLACGAIHLYIDQNYCDCGYKVKVPYATVLVGGLIPYCQ